MTTLNDSMAKIMTLDGSMAVAVVDSSSGMMLGHAGGGIDLDLAAAGNTEVVRSKIKTMQSLNLKDTIEDILITLGKQYHIIRPVAAKAGLFLYVVLDRAKSNLALARSKTGEVEKDLVI